MKPYSKLPWHTSELHASQFPSGKRIAGENGYSVACVMGRLANSEDGEQNAAYIVHACNLYPELVEALRGIMGEVDALVEDETLRLVNVEQNAAYMAARLLLDKCKDS